MRLERCSDEKGSNNEAASGLEGREGGSAVFGGGDSDFARFMDAFEAVFEVAMYSGEALGFVQISDEFACFRGRRMPALVLLR
jgi:hypothetical protein